MVSFAKYRPRKKKELNGCPQIPVTVRHIGRTTWHRKADDSAVQVVQNVKVWTEAQHFIAFQHSWRGSFMLRKKTVHIPIVFYLTTLTQRHVLDSADIYRYHPEFSRQRRTLQQGLSRLQATKERANQPKSYLGLFNHSCVLPHRLAQWQTP